jgi:beta-lactamase class A
MEVTTASAPPSTIAATTPPDPTTTIAAVVISKETESTGLIRCRPDPFTPEAASANVSDSQGKEITAHVYDARTGCHYSLNPDRRQLSASVFKIIVMAGTLLEAQKADRELTEKEMSLLVPMITQSANGPVRGLWRTFGSSPWFREQGEAFGLSETRVVGDGGESWGGTRTSASDQVDLLRQILLGEWGPLDEEFRAAALDLMTSIVPEQSWGVTAGVPDSWTVAQKNGFAGSIVNSVGWAHEPGKSPGYVVAILSRGWPSHARGIAAVERINLLIADAMIDRLRNLE